LLLRLPLEVQQLLVLLGYDLAVVEAQGWLVDRNLLKAVLVELPWQAGDAAEEGRVIRIQAPTGGPLLDLLQELLVKFGGLRGESRG